MTLPSARHVPLLLGLVALLAVPLLRSRFEVRRADDCARPAALLDLAGLPGSGVTVERYEKYDRDLVQWTEADLRPPLEGAKLRGALIRSFRPIDLYTRPPAKLLGPIEAGERSIEWVDVDGERVPVQTMVDASNRRSTLASWVFVFGNEPVLRPLAAQLRRAPEQLWHGTRPLSLLLVAGPVAPARREAARDQARRWLLAAYRHHRSACTPAPEGPEGPPGA